MANRRIATMEIHELVRLARAGESTSTIARVLGLNRRTVIRYGGWATEHGLLTGDGHPVSYSAVWRLVQQLEPPTPEAVVRVEVRPGSEGQVDFGYAGITIDPRSGAERRTWLFVLVLSWSRHLYAELDFDQRVETWLLCHVRAFAAFGGTPARIVPDNLKAAIVRASFWQSAGITRPPLSGL